MAWSTVTGGKTGPDGGTLHTGRSITLGTVAAGDAMVAVLMRSTTPNVNDLGQDTLTDTLGSSWALLTHAWDNLDHEGISLWLSTAATAGAPVVSSHYANSGSFAQDSLSVEVFRSSSGVPVLDSGTGAPISNTTYYTCTYAGAGGALLAEMTPTTTGCLFAAGFGNFSSLGTLSVNAWTSDQQTNVATGANTLLEHLVVAGTTVTRPDATVGTVGVRYGGVALCLQPSGGTAATPVSLTAPIVSGVAQVGQTLTTDDGVWSGSPTSYAYQWQDDGGAGESEPTVSDDFASYSAGTIAGQAPTVWPTGWTDVSGDADGSGHYGGDGVAYYSGNYYATGGIRGDFRLMFTINAVPGTSSDNGIWCNFRTTDRDNAANPPTGVWSGYQLALQNVAGSKTYAITRQDDGGVVTVQAATALAYAVDDKIGLIFQGSSLQLWRKPSGGSWGLVNEWTDATFTNGWVGFEFNGTTVPKIDDFAIENSTTAFDSGGAGAFADIGGATSKSYTLVSGDVGLNVRCEVVASNTAGASLPAYSNELLVAPSATVIPRLLMLGIGGGPAGSAPPEEPPPTPGGPPQFGGPRIYSADSPWNTPLPADAWNHRHPDSVTMVTGFVTNSSGYVVGWSPVPGNAYGRWLKFNELIGRWWVDANLATVPVYCTYPSTHTSYVPIPANFVIPHYGSDTEHRTTIHESDGDSWGAWNVTYSSGAYHATMFDKRQPQACWQGAGTADATVTSGASRCPVDAGAISPQDFLLTPPGGHFNHAININISSHADGNTSGHPKFVYPAGQGDGRAPGLVGAPVGTRWMLDPSIDIDARSEPEYLKQVLRTMQIYGCISTDSSIAQGAGDGIMCLIHECGPTGYAYPFLGGLGGTDAYSNGVPLDLMPHFGVLDWNWHWPGGNP